MPILKCTNTTGLNIAMSKLDMFTVFMVGVLVGAGWMGAIMGFCYE